MVKKSDRRQTRSRRKDGNGDATQSFSNINATQSAIGTRGKVDIKQNVAGSSGTTISADVSAALATLVAAIRDSQSLTDEEKASHLEIVDEIKRESQQAKPRKSRIKVLVNGLLAALRAIPDISDRIQDAAALLTSG